jgi:serine/threonine protein kinase
MHQLDRFSCHLLLAWLMVLCLLCGCVQAVAGVHEQRIVHSDLKPANFLLVEGQLKLIDFGIAKAINGDTTSIARESQVRGKASALTHTGQHLSHKLAVCI